MKVAPGVLVLLLAGVAAADVTVDTTADEDVDDAACSLREAIVAVSTNASYHGCVRSPATVDAITFDVGSGTPSIAVTGSDLPRFSGPVIVDGSTGGATRVEITGGGALGTGLSFLLGEDATGSEIRNLVINGFTGRELLLSNGSAIVVEGNLLGTDATGTSLVAGSGAGIEICSGFSCGVSGGHRIGGTMPAQRNVIVAGTSVAISVGSSSGNTIQGNHINTDAAGTQLLSTLFTSGISVDNSNGTVIGGPNAGEGNVIAGFNGISIGGNPSLARSSGTVVQGNAIGTDATGTVDLGGGGDGIALGHAVDTQIGGAGPGAGNLVSGNVNGIAGGSSGVSGGSVDDTTVQGNLIGTDASGAAGLGNSGVGISLGDDAVIERNVIASNGGDGIDVPCVTCIQRISENAIHSNGGIGIDLAAGSPGVTENDPDDPDAGPNGRQNFPILDAVLFPGGTSISGTLDSTPLVTFRVEVFANDACDPSGNGEGQELVGAKDDVTTDANGDASFMATLDVSVPAGKIMTATAIAPDGSTSEFSPCTLVPPTTTSSTTIVTTSTTSSTTTSTASSTTTTSPTTTSTTTSTIDSSTTTSTTTSTSSTTTTTVPSAACELLDGKKLLLKSRTGRTRRGLGMLSNDRDVTLGGGNASTDDPLLHGGTLRVVSAAGDGFDDTYTLPADRWRYKGKEGAGKGYKLRPTKPFRSITIEPGKRVKVVANGEGLEHTLVENPDPVDVVLTIGAHCYCLRFGEDVTFKPDKKYLAKNRPAPTQCPPPASAAGAFVD